MIANRHGRTNLLSLSLLPGVSPLRFFVGFLTTTRRRDLDRRSAREKKKTDRVVVVVVEYLEISRGVFS